MADLPFQKTQRQFAAHIRDPKNIPPEGIEPRRLKIYTDLFYNNVANFIEIGFPVIHQLIEPDAWHQLVRLFLKEHASQSPYFVDIPGEFVRFLSEQPEYWQSDYPPFLLELAHYEYMEVVLSSSRESLPQTGVNPEGDLLAAAPYVSPLSCLVTYQWPVHQIGNTLVPKEPLAQPVWLMLHRDEDDNVRFHEISSATARLLQLMEAQPLVPGKTILLTLAEEMHAPDVNAILEFGLGMLQDLKDKGVILGTRIEDIQKLSNEED